MSKSKLQPDQKSTVKTRNRYLQRKTNYYHRYKMLKNYENIYRLLFLKKNHFCIAGVYQTTHPGQPDIAKLYLESRYFNLKRNLKDTFQFGKIVAQNLNMLFEKKVLNPEKTLILDLKNHKKIVYKEFIAGIHEVLNKNIQNTFLNEFKS